MFDASLAAPFSIFDLNKVGSLTPSKIRNSFNHIQSRVEKFQSNKGAEFLTMCLVSKFIFLCK